MALPTIKIACSNGHFQESLQNHGDTGTWTSNDGTSPTKLIDSGADWVVDEWIGYYVVFDTGGTPTPIIITDNDQTSITVAGDYSAQVGKNYRIAGGITGTVTANASASDEIALTAVKDKYGTAHNPIANEFAKMVFVPDKLDGTAYTIVSNIAGTAATTLTIDTSIAVTATSCEVGRGASATLYPEAVNISGEINEPKTLSANIMYDIDSTFEDDESISNPLQLGSFLRVSETTGNNVVFEGYVYETPVDKDADKKMITVTAMDRLAILDHTVIPVTTDEPSAFSYGVSTPQLEAGAQREKSYSYFLQTKGFNNYSYAPRPLAISEFTNTDTDSPYHSTHTNGTWGAEAATTNSGKNDDGTSNGKVLRFATGGFLTGEPGLDCVDDGCVVIKLDSTAANARITYVSDVNTDTKLTTTDDVSWASGDKFIILSKSWQVGAGVESDADYVDRSGTDGFKIEHCLREELEAATDDAEKPSENPTKTKMYVGRNSTFSSRDGFYDYSGRGWLLIMDGTEVEIAQYSGYLPDPVKDKWYLNAYNKTPQTSRNTRNDLTGNWKVDGTFSDTGSRTWAADTNVFEIFPNRHGIMPPITYFGDEKQSRNIGSIPSEGIIQLALGDDKNNGRKNVRVNFFSYDGDAKNANPDKGTENSAVDITDIVEVACKGLSSTSATPEDIISTSKLLGGPGLMFSDDSLNTGIYINKFEYRAFGENKSSIHPKELIDKICEDGGLLYDLRYDDNSGEVIFKPLKQKATADITIAAGGITSLAREKDVSDVFSAMLLQVSSPKINYFDPANILQYGCEFTTSGAPSSSNIPDGNVSGRPNFSSGGYSGPGGTPPDFFWARTHLKGLGPDVVANGPYMDNNQRMLCQSVWRKDYWETGGGRHFMKVQERNAANGGVYCVNSDGDSVPLITMWMKDGVTLKTLDNFAFTCWKADDNIEKRNRLQRALGDTANYKQRYVFRVEVSDNVDLTDPLNTGTWIPYNDYASMIDTGYSNQGSHRFYLNAGGPCELKNIKGIRIRGIVGVSGFPGGWGEGRELTRLKSNPAEGWQTWGETEDASGAAGTGLAEDFNYSERPPGNNFRNKEDPQYNYNGQDSPGIWSVNSWKNNGFGTQMKSGFENAIKATDTSSGAYAGYAQAKWAIGNFKIKGDGVFAMHVRVTKNQEADGSPERITYSPSYKKIAGLGYKVNPISLENFSDAEALTLGHRFLDDKLRRYQARDYSLDGLSPFLNSNNLPHLGQTITITDDSNFTGVITSYEFTMDAEGARFDFRLEDYDRNKTAQYIQAK